jgi:hypothetical protein
MNGNSIATLPGIISKQDIVQLYQNLRVQKIPLQQVKLFSVSKV